MLNVIFIFRQNNAKNLAMKVKLEQKLSQSSKIKNACIIHMQQSRDIFNHFLSCYKEKCNHMLWELKDMTALITPHTKPNLAELHISEKSWQQMLSYNVEYQKNIQVYFEDWFNKISNNGCAELHELPKLQPEMPIDPPNLYSQYFKSLLHEINRLKQQIKDKKAPATNLEFGVSPKEFLKLAAPLSQHGSLSPVTSQYSGSITSQHSDCSSSATHKIVLSNENTFTSQHGSGPVVPTQCNNLSSVISHQKVFSTVTTKCQSPVSKRKTNSIKPKYKKSTDFKGMYCLI